MNLKMLKKVNKFNVVPTILTTEKFFIFSVFAVPLFFLFLLLAASDCNNGLACGLSTLSFYLIFFKSLAIMIIYYLAVRTNLKKIRQKSDIPIINPYKGLILASLLLFFLLARLTLDTVRKSYYCGSINCINLDKTRIIEKLRDKNIQQSLYINDPIYAPYTSVSIPGKQNIFSIFKMLKPEDYTRTAIELNDKKICHLLPASTKWVYANGLPADSRWIYINECLQAVNKSKEH